MAEAAPTQTTSEWLTEEFSNPINIALIVVIVYMCKKILERPPPPPPPKKERKIEPRNFTVEELWGYNGLTPQAEWDGEKPIYLALKGTVFDVTRGRNFYGPGSSYENMAGRNATRMLATMDLESFREGWDDCDDLSASEQSTVNDWFNNFSAKYPIRGKLVKSHDAADAPSATTKEE